MQAGHVESAPWTNIDVRRIRYGERRRTTDATLQSDGNDTTPFMLANYRTFSFTGYVEDGLPNLINKDVELTGTLEFEIAGDEPMVASVVIQSFEIDVDYDDTGQIPISGTGHIQGAMTKPAR